MAIDSVSMRLIAPNVSRSSGVQTVDLARMANGSAAARMGIVQSNELPGSYRGIYEARSRVIETPVTETRSVTRSEAVFETREIREDQAVFEDRAITEQRALFEDRAVYEERAIRETSIEGSRSIQQYRTASQAGIDSGADLAIKVGDGATATIRFENNNRISVSIGQTTQRFNYSSAEGSFAATVVSAFNSVDGLSASFTAEGKLALKADNAQSVQVADVANGWFDWSGSPLAALGLRSGRTDAQTVGTERVQTGSERVQVGEETVVIGSERIQTGMVSVLLGTEQIKIGERQVVVGEETVVTGSTKVVRRGERELVGLERSDDAGLGDLDVLDRLSRTTMPAGYVEALFGLLEAHEPAAEETAARVSYSEVAETRRADRPVEKSESRAFQREAAE